MIIERTLQQAIRAFIGKYPILAVTGPRQSGKTTMLRHLFSDYRYVSLENLDNRDFALNDPNGFFKQYDSHVIIDEIQQAPDLFSYMQTIVDEQKQMGQYIISGSQNFMLMERITQSLAGRIALFKLFPFDIEELSTSNLLSEDYLKTLIRGFYPAIYDRKIPSKQFYNNYLQTYVQRDVSSLLSIKDLRLFRNFIGLCAARAGQLLNLNDLAKDCGISQPTAKAWLSTLESSYIVFLLHPYFENFSKRIIKSPKLYFYDTGLLAFLQKFNHPEQLINHAAKGNLFENMIIADVVKKISHTDSTTEAWFWRDAAGHELDLLLVGDEGMRICEIKTTQTIMSKMFKGLDYFEKISGKTKLNKTVIYAGDEDQERSNGSVFSWKRFTF
ncbi:MAG: ATP-binding protein [Bacteroidales bacterium]|jgi:predicted AAA+ superfamily ATPase